MKIFICPKCGAIYKSDDDQKICGDCKMAAINTFIDENTWYSKSLTEKNEIKELVKNGKADELINVEKRIREEQERRDAEELERIKIAEERAREAQKRRDAEELERRERYLAEKVEKLKAFGLDGYYEYKVVSISDQNTGGLDTVDLENRLTTLGLDGWHLRCAYSNELGHNTSSGGIAGFSLGTNSTIDQNILIFERFVKI